MPPRNRDEDNTAIFSTAEGIKDKVQQLHLRLKSCVETLEMVSGSAGEQRKQLSGQVQLSKGGMQDSRFFGAGASQSAMQTPSGAGKGAGPRDARRSTDTSAPRDDAAAQHDSHSSIRPAANGVSCPESCGGPGSDEVEWEEDMPLGDEVDEGIEMCLGELEHLRGIAGSDRPSRYPTDGEPPPPNPSAPPGACVKSALSSLKQSLSPAVRSSLQGFQVPTHGEQLRSQYQKAVGDTVQRRLVGRADNFHTSGSLEQELTWNDSARVDSNFCRSSSLTHGHQAAVHEAGSGGASPGLGSPLHSLAPALGPTAAARAALRVTGEPGQQQLPPHLQHQPAIGFRPPPLQIRSVGGDALQPEDGVVSPSSPRRDVAGGPRSAAAPGRSRIPQQQAISRFAVGDSAATQAAAASTSAAAQRSSGPMPQLQRSADESGAVASDGREGPASSSAGLLHPPSAAAAETAASSAAAAPPINRLLSKSRDQISSMDSSGSGGLGWKFLAAESGGSMLISFGSSGYADGGDGEHGPGSRVGLSVNSPHSPLGPGAVAQPGAQSNSGGATAVVGLVPPGALVYGAVSSGSPSAASGFVPPPEVIGRRSAGITVAATPAAGFMPPAEITCQSGTANAPPCIGFVPPPEVMGQSSAAAAALDATPSIGFAPPPGLMATAGCRNANGHSSPSSAAGQLALGLKHGAVLGPFYREPIQERPPASTAVRTVDMVRLGAEPGALQACASDPTALASRIPVGDFSFGINTKVFSSSCRLKIRSSGGSLTAAGRQGPAEASGRGMQVVSEEGESSSRYQEQHQQQGQLIERPSLDSSAASAAWPPPSPAFSYGGPQLSAAGAAGSSLEGRGSQRSPGWRSDCIREQLSSNVSGGPRSDGEQGGSKEGDCGCVRGALVGKLPWEETSSEEGEEGASSSAVYKDGVVETVQRQGMPAGGSSQGLGVAAASGPGSPFASAIAAAATAAAAVAARAGGPPGAATAAPPPSGFVGRQPPPLPLTDSEEVMAFAETHEQMLSPLQASGISVATYGVDNGGRNIGAKPPAATAHASSRTTLAGRDTASAPPRAPETLSRNLEPSIRHIPSVGSTDTLHTASPHSSGIDGISITITDADIARSGGMVPALLEVVRERFRQKGVHNLAHLAATGSGGGATVLAEANSAPLSPALRGETLAERIVARVDHFHTRKAEGLAMALGSNSSGLEEGLRLRDTEDGGVVERLATCQSAGCSTESVPAVVVCSLPQPSASHASEAARHPGSGIPSLPAPPAMTMPVQAGTRFAVPATARADTGSNCGSERSTPRSPSSRRRRTAGTSTSPTTEPSKASSEGIPVGPNPNCAPSSPTTTPVAPLATKQAAAVDAWTLMRASTPTASPTPSASASAFSPPGAAAQALSPAGSAGGSGHKAEQGTQTPSLPESAAAAPGVEGNGPPLPLLPQGTAQAFFLSTTVPLTARSAGAHGDSLHDAAAAAANRLLQPPDSPTICTAADFFRGTASRATLNTSAIATPLQELPSGTTPTSAFLAASSVAAAAAQSLSGPSPRGRPRNARESTTLPSQAGSSVAASHPGRQSASGRVSISAGGGGLAGRGGRVVIDEEPVNMEIPSSRAYGYQPRRYGAGAAGTALAAGHSTARVAFEEVAGAGSTVVEPGASPGAAGTGRSLTREMLMRLAHLGGREQGHAFETTTDEEREEQERQAKRRARRERALAGHLGSPRRRTTGDLAGSPALLRQHAASSAHQHQQYERSSGHGHRSHHAHFGGGAVGAAPRQLAVVISQEEACGSGSGTHNSSPAIAAAPGDLIALPPLSLDAPDMPEPGGGDAPGCAPISPVALARGGCGGAASASHAATSASQLPPESAFVPRSREGVHGRTRTEAGRATPSAAAASTPEVAGRRAVQSAGGSGFGAAAGAAQGASRLSRSVFATEGGGGGTVGDGRRGSHGRHRRSNTPGTQTTTTVTTTSWSDASHDDDDREGEGVGGESLAARRRAAPLDHASTAPGTADPQSGARGSADKALQGRPSGRVGRHFPGRAAAAAAARLSATRTGGTSGCSGAVMDWGTGSEDDDCEQVEEELRGVPYHSFEVEEDDADGEERPSLSRGASSAAASVLSQKRYVAAARAHRSVSEANSAKRPSCGALPLDDDTEGTDGVERPGRCDGRGSSQGAAVRRPRGSGELGRDCGTWQDVADERAGRRRARKAKAEKEEGPQVPYAATIRTAAAAVGNGKGAAGGRGAADGPATWRSARVQAEHDASGGGLTSKGSRIRQSLQRLLDLRASASSGREQSGSSAVSEQSTTAPPAAKRPAATAAAQAAAAAGAAAATSGAAAERKRPSPSPSVTATAGGATEADAVDRDAPLLTESGQHGASALHRRQSRPTLLGQQDEPGHGQQQHRPRRRQQSAGSHASSSDAPPEDPLGLVSPNYTQDMAEEEYGWDAATGDTDVDNLTSPRGRRAPGGSATGGTPRGPSSRRRGRGRRTSPPPLPYDPAEVPSAGVNDACASYTSELEQQVLIDAVSELIGILSPTPASEGSRAPADEEPSFSLTPRGRRSGVGGTAAGHAAKLSRRSSPSVVSGSWFASARSSPGEPDRWSPSLPQGSPSGPGLPRGAAASPAAASPEKTSTSNFGPEGSAELQGSMSGTQLPSWLSAVLNHPHPPSGKAATAAAAVQPGTSGDGSGAANHAAPSSLPPASSSPNSPMHTALAELLEAVRPFARQPGEHPKPKPHGLSDGASLMTLQLSLESPGAAGALESVAAAVAARLPGRGNSALAAAADACTEAHEQGGSGWSSTASSPDPELRRLLLSAWSRWYLRKTLGPSSGSELFDDNRAEAAAAAAQARLQALAAAHSRSGSEAWDGVSPSVDLREAANASRLHISFTRWLGQTRFSRRAAYRNGGNPHRQDRWAEPRSSGARDSAPGHALPTSDRARASNIAPPYPTCLMGSVSQPVDLGYTEQPSAAPSRPPGTDWAAALRAAVSPPPQPRSSAYPDRGPVQQFNSAGTGGWGYAGGAAAGRPAGPSGTLSTPTVSRTSGVRQIPSNSYQQQQWQQPWQVPSSQQHPSYTPSPRQQWQQYDHQQQHPPPPQTMPFQQMAPPQQQVASWLSTGSPRPHTAPQQRPALTPRSSLLQQHSAAATASARPLGAVFADSSAAAASGSDLESYIAMHLLDGLGSGSDGVILAGLQLATGTAFQPDKSHIRPPSPRPGSGTGEYAAVAASSSGAPQGSPAALRSRAASTGRVMAASSQQPGLFSGNALAGSVAVPVGSANSILERTLLNLQQQHQAHAGPVGGQVGGGGGGLVRAAASPRRGVGSGSASSSGGGSLARGSASPRPASVSSLGAAAPSYSSVNGGLLGGGGGLARTTSSSTVVGPGAGGGSGSIDLLRSAPSSPRPALSVVAAAAAGPPVAASHGAAYRTKSLSSGGVTSGPAAWRPGPHASPRSSLLSATYSVSDNIRAPEAGTDQINPWYYGLRP